MLVAAGCRTSASPQTRQGNAVPQIDPCADNLHDVCGQLLLYYAKYHKLPPQLEELKRVGTVRIPMVCPVTRKPYVYDPKGLQVSDWPGKVIMYEAVPCFGKECWGILVEFPKDDQPLLAHVVRIPTSAIPSPESRRP